MKNPKPIGLLESIFFNAFSAFKRGVLRMDLPDGRVFWFGEADKKSILIRASITVHRGDFFKKCVLFGDIGFGESYTDGDWDTPSIPDLIGFMIHNLEDHPAISGTSLKNHLTRLFHLTNNLWHRTRPNHLRGAKVNISEHYDLSNDFFRTFLDGRMVYSSGIFKDSKTSLEGAQEEKIDRLCRKLRLRPSDHLLEIGTGWGALAVHAAKRYGVKVTTATISREQFRHAQTLIKKEKLEKKVTVLLKDYRLIHGSFDRLVSCEMLEAVGHRYLPVFFKKCHELLRPDGLMVHQVILSPDSRYESFRKGKDWIQKHIFPGSLLPSVSALLRAVRQTGDMDLWGMEELGLHYARTLEVWRERFNKNKRRVSELGFDEAFSRKWNYYLGYCEAAFRTRNITVAQMVFSRPNNPGMTDL